MSPQSFKASRLVRLEPVNHNQFGCTVDIHNGVSGHVETVCLLSKKNAKPKDYVEISVDAEDYYRIKSVEKEV